MASTGLTGIAHATRWLLRCVPSRKYMLDIEKKLEIPAKGINQVYRFSGSGGKSRDQECSLRSALLTYC